MASCTANSEPTNFGLTECSAKGLFSVRGLPKLTHLDRIYLNGLHTLLPFWITNETDQALEVALSMTPARALKFQRHNANWDAVSAASRKAYVEVQLANNIKGQSEVTLRCNSETLKDFCEVFNQIDGANSVVLMAYETAEVVLLVEACAPVVPGTELGTTAGSGAGEEGGSSGSTHFGFGSSHAIITLQAIAEEDLYVAQLRSSFCRSVLEMDPPTSRIYLDDCAVGKPYERVLRVRNASEIGLDWTMTVVETTDTTSLSSLQLLDADMRPLSGGHLAGCDATQIFVRYTPRAAGEFLCRFLVENSNDPSNQRYWVFRARATQRQKPKRIELIGDPDINFGNCTSGVWYNREIAFKNIGETPVVMRFRVEGNTSNLTMKSGVKAKQGPKVLSQGQPEDLSSSEQQGGPDGDSISDRSGAITTVAASDHTSFSTTSTAIREPGTPVQEPRDSGRHLQPRDRLAALHGAQPALFDEVLIKPGTMRTVVLSLVGNATCTASPSAGQFGTQSFTLFCECSAPSGSKQSPPLPTKGASSAADRTVERLSLPCTLNMCTSYVRVTPALLDFGTVDVGMLKTMYLQVENLSHVDATVQCRLESKVINCTRVPVVIPPLMSQTIRVDIYPRRINPRYRKQIIVCNTHNRFNDSVVEVRSTHVDQRRMAFHNLFYKTLVLDNEQNFVDFGAVPLNSRTVRMISLRNICRCPITIETSVSDTSNIATLPDTTSGSGGMVVVYKIVPLLKNGALTPEARLVARRLPLLERQAVIHSNIERFKEHSGGPLLAAEQAVASLSDSLASYSLARHNGHIDSNSATTLQPDMFVDKTVEQGHVCLVPFLSQGRSAGAHRSVDYLDIASAPKHPLSAVRIREGSLWQLSDKQPDEGASTPLSPLAANDHSTMTRPTLAYSELEALTPAGLVAAHTPEDVDTLEILGRARRLLSEIVDNLDLVPPVMFSSPQAEDEYVRRQVDLRKYIDLLVESGFLRPPRRMVLAAGSDRSLVIMMCPVEAPDVADKAVSPRFDANVYFRLVNRPSDLLPFTESGESAAVFTNSYQLPVRRFLVQASLCRTELEIGQKSINVGNMQVDEASRKYLVIKNQTETPLMYAIRKTGSIASGDIQFVDNNRYGVVRGFDSRKIVFVFTPSLTGTYSEQISIANVLDPQGGKTATLKAVVRRPSKFYIQSLLLEFGKQAEEAHAAAAESLSHVLKIGQQSDEAQLLVIKNMTAKSRQFVVKSIKDMQVESLPTPLSQTQLQQSRDQETGLIGAIPDTLPVATTSLIADNDAFDANVVLDPLFPADIATLAQSTKVLDRETEEKIEALEQKLKIAVRKNRPEKVEKYTSKLSKLRGGGGALESDIALQSPRTPALAAEMSSIATTMTATGATPSATISGKSGIPSPPATTPSLVTIQRLAADTQLLVTLPANSEASIPVVVVPRMRSGSKLDNTEPRVVCARGQFVVHEGKDKDNVKIVTLRALVEIDASDKARQ